MSATEEPTPLRKVPERGAKMESHGIVIEWDFPKPPQAVVWKPNMDNWYRRLAPLKSTPGRRARVCRDLRDIVMARGRAQNIRRSLRDRDPRSKWKVEQGKMDDDTYSIWVTYNGVMSEAEYQEAVALHEYRSKRSKLVQKKARDKKILRAMRLNPTLKPPVVRPED